MSLACTAFLLLFYFTNKVVSLPPDPCQAAFNSKDCGLTPVPVMYYWKPGSRCEVGFWRGCYPNFNMFKDEYECVSTCIFSARVAPEDYHSYNEIEQMDMDYDYVETTTSSDNDTLGNSTQSGNTTDAGSGGNSTGGVTQPSGNGTGGADAGETTGEPTAAAEEAPAERRRFSRRSLDARQWKAPVRNRRLDGRIRRTSNVENNLSNARRNRRRSLYYKSF